MKPVEVRGSRDFARRLGRCGVPSGDKVSRAWLDGDFVSGEVVEKAIAELVELGVYGPLITELRELLHWASVR